MKKSQKYLIKNMQETIEITRYSLASIGLINIDKRSRGQPNIRGKDACERDTTDAGLKEDNITNRASQRTKIYNLNKIYISTDQHIFIVKSLLSSVSSQLLWRTSFKLRTKTTQYIYVEGRWTHFSFRSHEQYISHSYSIKKMYVLYSTVSSP